MGGANAPQLRQMNGAMRRRLRDSAQLTLPPSAAFLTLVAENPLVAAVFGKLDRRRVGMGVMVGVPKGFDLVEQGVELLDKAAVRGVGGAVPASLSDSIASNANRVDDTCCEHVFLRYKVKAGYGRNILHANGLHANGHSRARCSTGMALKTWRNRALCALAPLVCFAAERKSAEWLTWGGGPERTGWNASEKTFRPGNVGRLRLRWKARVEESAPLEAQTGNATVTAPLVASAVPTARGAKTLVFTLSVGNTLAALDADTGETVWKRSFANRVEPKAPATWLCTNTVTATPVIDKQAGAIYFLTADGTLRGLALADGSEKMPAVEFTPPYSRNWSLNLVDGVLYTTVGRGCGGTMRAPIPSAMVAMDLRDPGHRVVRFDTSQARPAGAWGRAGMVHAFDSFFVQTADGPFDPATGKWGETLLRLAPKTLELLDYFTPASFKEMNAKDLDFGSSGPVAFTWRGRDLAATGGKDGTVYLLDAKALGGDDHHTPLASIKIGNDAGDYASTGIWGAMTTWADAKGERWLFVPMWGPPSKTGPAFQAYRGEAPNGSVMAIRLATIEGKPALQPMWASRDLSVPDPPVVAGGVVFAISTGENTIQNHRDPRYEALYGNPSKLGGLTPAERAQHTTHATLYAFDAETGKELYSSGETIDDWTHLSSVTVAAGKVFVTTRNTTVWAFGIGN